MEKEFVPYNLEDPKITFKTAKLAKEKGLEFKSDYFYDEILGLCYFNYEGDFVYYNSDKGLQYIYDVNGEFNELGEKYYAITQSLLAKWLREEHNIHVTSQIGNLDFISTYHYDIRYIVKNKFMCKVKGNFKTYEEALEVGLQEALQTL